MPNVRMAMVYEIGGRLLIRTQHNYRGAGIEDDYTVVMDGYPGIAPSELDQAVQTALERCRDVPMPSSWPSIPDYARPLLESSPRRYRSYRSWQRAARLVTVRATSGAVNVVRWLPDLGRGGWVPALDGQADDNWTYELTVADDTGVSLGTAILTVLEAPPLQSMSG